MARFVRLQYSQNKTTAWHDAKKESKRERERDKQHQVTATATILTRKEEEDEYEGRIGEKQQRPKATVALTDKTRTQAYNTRHHGEDVTESGATMVGAVASKDRKRGQVDRQIDRNQQSTRGHVHIHTLNNQ